MPRISVIIPTWNRAQRLKNAIDSVLKQTYHDFDLCIVDDCSNDNTLEVIESFRNQIKPIFFHENRGVSSSRNAGINATDSEWIAFLDSDDLWHPEKLEKQMTQIKERKDIPLHFTDEIWFSNGVHVNPKHRHRKQEGWIFQPSLALCLIAPSTVLLKRKLLDTCGFFDEQLPACEDYDLWLRITAHNPVALLNEPLIIRHGGHEDQLSRRFWGMDRFRVKSLYKIIHKLDLKSDDHEAAKQMLIKKCGILIDGSRKRNKTKDIKYYENLIHEYSIYT